MRGLTGLISSLIRGAAWVGCGLVMTAVVQGAMPEAETILDESGVAGGLVVHVGCGDGRLTAALGADDRYLVHGLDEDAANVEAARAHTVSLGRYGRITIDRWSGQWLPYVDNLVNLLVVSSQAAVDNEELMRVLAPGGVAIFTSQGAESSGVRRVVKPWPDEIDEWTHYLHGPDNNAVAMDSRVGPPRHMQWVGGPRWTRHHDWLNSISGAVTAGGRLFYVVDEASPANMNLPGKWAVAARDAFSGITLWKRPIESWVWHRVRFRSGPPQAPRLLVASRQRLYMPLGLNEPISVLDAKTGETVTTYEETDGAEEIILTGDTLLVLKGEPVAEQAFSYRSVKQRHDFPNQKTLMAVDTGSGKVSWTRSLGEQPLPETLASDGTNAYLRFDDGVTCFHMQSGKERWHYEGGDAKRRKPVAYGTNTLVVADGVVVCNLSDRLVALSAGNGKKLWECELGSAFHAPVDIFVIDGLVWHKLGHQMDPMRVPPDKREARDLHTGELKARDSVAEYLLTPGHHFRCYRGKATERYAIVSKRGVEMLDLAGSHHSRNNWLRGTCQYGILPANGLLYAPPHSCGCYSEAVLRGFWALAGERNPGLERRGPTARRRLQQGPAYDRPGDEKPAAEKSRDWPTYRHDARRSGVATTAVPAKLSRAWCAELDGRLTQPVVADGHVLLASVDAGIVYALSEKSGELLWKHIAGGRVDSPPTIHQGTVLFGSADGHVTALRLSDGELRWRFLAAPADLRGVAFDRLESPWPVHGSVLVLDGVAYASAGRSTWIDGGIYLCALDPTTGKLLHGNRLVTRHPKYEEREDTEAVHVKGHLWTDYKTFSQPDRSDTYSITGGVSDVPVSDGDNIFLRHLMFDRELAEQQERSLQLFSTSSLLDDNEHHRSDWGVGAGEHERLPAA
ncbi:MAG: PQQ-binding-like beta-propeller repeat protein, partial [Planctomycetota bacterium]